MRKVMLTVLTVSMAAAWCAALDEDRSAALAGPPRPHVPVGCARIDITPGYPVRLMGYASRQHESEGVTQRIWAKALAIGGDQQAAPAVLLAVENCGVPAWMTKLVARRLHNEAGLPASHLVVCSTHSHAAPSLKESVPMMFMPPVPAAHKQHVDRYSRELPGQLVEVALKAITNRSPARLTWGAGEVGFAANRRVLKDGHWVGFGVHADGPVDHSLPVLVARDPGDKRMIAIVANYACHCTTLGGDFNQICGDWAGYAQQMIEAHHPGAMALITIGCGADANPQPRGDLDQCKRHGRALAAEVQRLIQQELEPLTLPLECRLAHIDLPFAKLPDREDWQQRARHSDAVGHHARHFLARMDKRQAIPRTLSYPVATWTFGDDLAMVFLGGEVVVDYAIRLKNELPANRLWITAFANDVACYIPSKRILREGGYEADSSMLFYGQPTRFAPQVEDLVVDTVRRLLAARF